MAPERVAVMSVVSERVVVMLGVLKCVVAMAVALQ